MIAKQFYHPPERAIPHPRIFHQLIFPNTTEFFIITYSQPNISINMSSNDLNIEVYNMSSNNNMLMLNITAVNQTIDNNTLGTISSNNITVLNSSKNIEDEYKLYFISKTKTFSKIWNNLMESAWSLQKPTNNSIERTYLPLDLVFLIDASTSLGLENFEKTLKFVNNITVTLPVSSNLTRIALITFSSESKIFQYFDQISRPKANFDKCQLVQYLNRISYTKGSSFTYGAFKEANKILRNARSTSKKIIFLITDGFSNLKDPRPLANYLKNIGIEIFSFGICNGNHLELRQISSKPWTSHYYSFHTFDDLVEMSNQLHAYYTSKIFTTVGHHYHLVNDTINRMCSCQYSTRTSIKCGCKDQLKMCYCNSFTGEFECLCPKGMYSEDNRTMNKSLAEDAMHANCKYCPEGSYKNIHGNQRHFCKLCPGGRNSTIGSISIDDCKCPAYYKSIKGECTVLKCPKLILPSDTYFAPENCSNIVNEVCGMLCKPGYKLVDGDNFRLCQHNLTWTGKNPTCQIQMCPKLSKIPHSSISCKDINDKVLQSNQAEYEMGTSCDVRCLDNKTLVGQSRRTCLPFGTWDGIRNFCREQRCPPLSPIDHGYILPSNCLYEFSNTGKNCEYNCFENYSFHGSQFNTCLQIGSWNISAPTCIPANVT
ncbi:unnamed protein product, partial [Gordionus sp. m RMFG-2023]